MTLYDFGNTIMALFFAISFNAFRANRRGSIGFNLSIISEISCCCSADSFTRVLPYLPPLSKIGVRINPGHSTLTRMPRPLASPRSDVERPTTACFVVVYETIPGQYVIPAREAEFTICPNPWFVIMLYVAWIPLSTPRPTLLRKPSKRQGPE